MTLTDEEKEKVAKKILKDAKLFKNKSKRKHKKKKLPAAGVAMLTHLETSLFIRNRFLNFNEAFWRRNLKNKNIF